MMHRLLVKNEIHFKEPGVNLTGAYYRDCLLSKHYCLISGNIHIITHFKMALQLTELVKLLNCRQKETLDLMPLIFDRQTTRT